MDSESDEKSLRIDTDIEAQPLLEVGSGERSPPLIDSEYRVSTSKKLAALAAYFCLNLGLTLYNKAVLGQVHSLCPKSLIITVANFLEVQIPMAPHCYPLNFCVSRMLGSTQCGLFSSDEAWDAGEPRPRGLFVSVHNQYRHVQCFPGYGVHPIPPDHAIHHTRFHDSYLPRVVCTNLRDSNLPFFDPSH